MDVCEAPGSLFDREDTLWETSSPLTAAAAEEGIHLPQIHTLNGRSVFLVLQSALPVLLFSKYPMKLVLRGTTNEGTVPPIDFANYIFLPFVKKHFGVVCDIHTHNRGVLSLGDGEVSVIVKPLSRRLNGIPLLERGSVISLMAVYWSSDEYVKVPFPKIPKIT